jgi:hypothetical protein
MSMAEIACRTKAPLRYNDHRLAIRAPEAHCKPWPRTPHARRPFHKAFFRWYAMNEEGFAIKLELLKRTDTCLDIGFCKIDRVVTAGLTDDEINVYINWQGTFWDMFDGFETYPRRVPNGYVCDQCPENDRPVFPSREALWRAEVFEPFLVWVNDRLANAEAIALSGTPDRITWARLVGGSSDMGSPGSSQAGTARKDRCEDPDVAS